MMILALTVLGGALAGGHGALPDFPLTFGEMKAKTGYYTASGKYLGGIPKANELEREIYECLEYSNGTNTSPGTSSSTLDSNMTSANTTCLEWRANEAGDGIFEKGFCTCKMLGKEGRYCAEWTCNQSNGNVNAAICECDIVNDSGNFCESWSCKQTDCNGREEFEYYDCARYSSSGHYCDAWTGQINATDEIEVLACECVAEWHSDSVCSYWECEELSLGTCASSGPSWCNLAVSVGVGGGLGMLGIMYIFGKCQANGQHNEWITLLYCFQGILWCLIWAVPVVIWGGEDGAMYVGIIWGVSLLFCVAYGASLKHGMNILGKSSSTL